MKYDGITYPFFGIDVVPDEVKYTQVEVYFTINNKKLIVDDKTINKDSYLDRLVVLKKRDDCIEFKYTASGVQEILFSRIPFGVDYYGKVFDLSKKEEVPFKCARIEKIKKDYLWVKGVSYPFRFRYGIVINANRFLFAHLVKVNNVWHFYDVSYEYDDRKTTKI